MLYEKSRKRGIRRFRSENVLHRRIRERKDSGWWSDEWDGTPRNIGRLMNTPKPCRPLDFCSNPRRLMSGKKRDELTLQEQRAFQPEEGRPTHGKKRRDNTPRWERIQCMWCGFIVGRALVHPKDYIPLWRYSAGRCPNHPDDSNPRMSWFRYKKPLQIVYVS